MLALSLGCSDALATAQYVYTYLPSAPGRDVRDINNSGQLVGNNCPTIQRCDSYVYSAGVFTSFNPPNADAGGSAANKINNAGAIAGNYASATYPGGIGYVASGSNFVDNVVGNQFTATLGIANNGAIAGAFSNGDLNPNLTTVFHGFAQFTPAGPIVDFGANTVAWGVNSFNQVVYDSNVGMGGQAAFLYSNGVSTPIVIPGAYSIGAVDINDAGQIVGSFRTSRNGPFSGFIATNGSYGILTPQLGGSINLYGINDLGQVAGYENFGYSNGILNAVPFYVTLANTPDAIVNGSYTFSVQVIGGVPVFIDPVFAVGYDYAIGNGDPNFESVRLPIGIGDDFYTITLPNGSIFVVTGGDLFDFTTHGYSGGLTNFSVAGIEIGAGLDPADSNAFVTGLTFVGNGFFTGTMTPVTTQAAVDEPATLLLLTIALSGFGYTRRRRHMLPTA